MELPLCTGRTGTKRRGSHWRDMRPRDIQSPGNKCCRRKEKTCVEGRGRERYFWSQKYSRLPRLHNSTRLLDNSLHFMCCPVCFPKHYVHYFVFFQRKQVYQSAQIFISKCHGLNGLNHRGYFLVVLGVGSPRSRLQKAGKLSLSDLWTTPISRCSPTSSFLWVH